MKIHLTGDDSLSPPCRVSVSRKVIFNPFSSSTILRMVPLPHRGRRRATPLYQKKNPPSQKLSGFFSICIKLQWVNRKSSN